MFLKEFDPLSYWGNYIFGIFVYCFQTVLSKVYLKFMRIEFSELHNVSEISGNQSSCKACFYISPPGMSVRSFYHDCSSFITWSLNLNFWECHFGCRTWPDIWQLKNPFLPFIYCSSTRLRKLSKFWYRNA